MTPNNGKTLLVLFSTGDLGDVGRHAVAAALEQSPAVVRKIRVLSRDPSTLKLKNWKCGCDSHRFSSVDTKRLEIHPFDCTKDDMGPHLKEVDAVISCLGNRQAFHPDMVARTGTASVVLAMTQSNCKRLVLLSSVGIGNDWPPLSGSREGAFLAGFFRTIGWEQYEDLSGAERVLQTGTPASQLDYLTVRVVLTPEKLRPGGVYTVQHEGQMSTMYSNIAKMDAARFLVEEAVSPTLHRSVVLVGGSGST
mmetsp:Transcript_17228/g.39956  ORF Transcript_17228/g.39956 Transcript_17228/m.39956 type:complete len:251 (+) Transcript_17228:1511-2263(+)